MKKNMKKQKEQYIQEKWKLFSLSKRAGRH